MVRIDFEYMMRMTKCYRCDCYTHTQFHLTIFTILYSLLCVSNGCPDPPYTGNWPVRFQYVIANTLGFTARTIPNGIETLLLTETTDLVERVITDTFGGFPGNASDEGDVVATMQVTDLDIDDDNDDDNDDPNDNHNDDGLGTARAHIVGGVSHDGGVRRQLLRGFLAPSATADRRHRKVQVLYEPGSVVIVELQDIGEFRSNIVIIDAIS